MKKRFATIGSILSAKVPIYDEIVNFSKKEKSMVLIYTDEKEIENLKRYKEWEVFWLWCH